jgi:hypothetical protein
MEREERDSRGRRKEKDRCDVKGKVFQNGFSVEGQPSSKQNIIF